MVLAEGGGGPDRFEPPAGVVVRTAVAADAPALADLADARRRVYEAFSPVFWRPARDARAKHLPYLAALLAGTAHTALIAQWCHQVAGAAIAGHGAGMPPFVHDPARSWLLDDFYVAAPDLWATVGRALLDAVADVARAAGQDRLIVVSAAKDAAKTAMLAAAGFSHEASWWVHPVQPARPALMTESSPAVRVGPAPPVYDPGGPVALAWGRKALCRPDTFLQEAAAAGAVLAVVPVLTADRECTRALVRSGYTEASQWHTRPLGTARP